MTKPIIAFDLDDVLADSTEFWRVTINEQTGLGLTADLYRVPGDYWGYYENIWREHKVDELITLPDINTTIVEDQSGISAYAEALEILTGLKKRYRLVVVTARGGNQIPESERWLQKNFPDIFSEIIFTAKAIGEARQDKGEVCEEIGARWLVDDNPSHCQHAIDRGVGAILFGEFGWHTAVPAQAISCKDWQAVRDYFSGQN